MLSKERKILIKPNLVNASKHPVTTDVASCKAIIKYIRAFSNAEIIIGEGCGEAQLDTDEIFKILGYEKLKKYDVKLLDLNYAKLKKLENKNFNFFPEIFLPEIAFSSFIISISPLKAHSLAIITGALKNMMGFAPPKYYSGKYGIWKKAIFHKDIHNAIFELNQYRKADLSIIDASIGLSEYHLGGKFCNPPIKKIIASFDPFKTDKECAKLLGFDYKKIPHIMKMRPLNN